MNHNLQKLADFQPQHSFFVGFDSDGTVFDTMEIKQKECFCPNNVKYWNLQPVSKYAREVAEFVNLYSKWRGSNRFPALLKTLELLQERAEVKNRGFKLPDLTPLREWINSGVPLGNATLAEECQKTGDPVLKTTLEWSLAINKTVEEIVHDIPTFSYVKESLARLAPHVDMICTSQTPIEALKREWSEHDLAKYVALFADQEYGNKSDHLRLTAGGKYPHNRILMVGDALGDLQAAEANGVLFYPILPGREDESWKQFYEEGIERFLNGQFEGEYQLQLINQFKDLLPEKPWWISS
ncbi:MAG TPA: HAD family hydrolase [Bacillota bacterium]|jgi:phosphoglycolate phosphatase-like HAD superfamily hydrolase|nr:HAD family hydrolase [Bacillota bacterium]HOL08907.1 HAD family hydrolase [Bacillota bacterium]HPO96600.1 HAD family hydrolase [Bacillota bacterium]